MHGLKTLSFSTLLSDAVQPRHGIFLAHLARAAALSIRHVGPVPYFPSGHPRFGSYAQPLRVPALDVQVGLRPALLALAEGIRALQATPPDRATNRRHAETSTWGRTAAERLQAIRDTLAA